jgi:hypothetical protein
MQGVAPVSLSNGTETMARQPHPEDLPPGIPPRAAWEFPAVIVAGPRRDGGKTLLRQLFSAAACIRDYRIALDKLTDLRRCRTADTSAIKR